MKASGELFNLIKSLSKTEKGYFKKFATFHVIGEENRYVRLFDLIEKQKVYDEKKAMRGIGLEEHPQNFAVLKSYLYNLILKTLRLYHSQSSPDIEVKEILEYIEILYNKGLYKQCDKLINKGFTIAEKYELFLPLAELASWKIELTSYSDKSPDYTENAYSSLFGYIKKYDTITTYKYLLSQFFAGKTSPGFTRKQEELSFHDKLSKNKLLTDKSNADSYQALWHFYLWKSLYAFDKYDYEEAYKYTTLLIELIEKYPWWKDLKPKSYISALNNHLVLQLETGRYSELSKTLTKFKAIKPKSDNVAQWLFHVINSAELNFYMHTGEFKKGVELVTQIENQLNEQRERTTYKDNEMTLLFNMALTFFGDGKFTKANLYINKIIHESHPNLRTDVQCFARIMSLIVHYEMGNNDLLEYTVKSTYRYLYKRKTLYKFETLILLFMKKHMGSKYVDEKKLTAGFKKLISDIETLQKDYFEKKALHYFDFVSWLKSKIEKKKFADVVKEKATRELKGKSHITNTDTP